MISVPPGVRVWLAVRPVDMHTGFEGLAAVVQQHRRKDPFSGHLFVLRGRCSNLLKILVWDGQGLVLIAKRLEKGRFAWPSPATEQVRLSPAELAMLPEGIDCQAWQRTDDPAPTLAS